MRRNNRKSLPATVLFFAAAAAALAGDVVVLRGGTRIELQGPWAIQGKNALLTRADGTLFSVPVSEIDRAATAAAKAAPPSPASSPAVVAPPATPAEAARMGRERPKARVRLTDADVGHQMDLGEPSGSGEETAPPGAALLEIMDYTQTRAGDRLVVAGSLRNSGGTTALNSRLTIAALNDAGETVASADAGLSNGTVEPYRSVSFTASLPVGEKTPSSFRFSPRWIAATPPAPPAPSPGSRPAAGTSGATAAPAGTAPPPPSAAAAQPAPPRTPYGQGVLYAAPPPSASFVPPADGKSGYIPGAASPENQPKPPQ